MPALPPTPGRDRSASGRFRPASPATTWLSPTRIGAGVDGTSSGLDAAALAALLARSTGAELMLITVHEEPPMQGLLPHEFSWSELEKEARQTLAATRDALAPEARIRVASDVLVWRGLRRVASLEHRDLLVVGSARGADAGRIALGASARDLVGHLACPLAIAPAGLRTNDRLSLSRIGVGFDGSPEAQAALGLARSLASVSGAALEVRGVVNDGGPGRLKTEQIVLGGEALVQRQLVSEFERDVAALGDTGVDTRLEVQAGSPAEVLSGLCERVDLVVIGSGRKSRPGYVGLGDTGSHLFDQARGPVLVVPRPQH